LSSDALQHGLSSLHLLIPRDWEKEEEASKIKKKQTMNNCILNFMIFSSEPFHEPYEIHHEF
jgi:hypothetical protein